MDQFGVLLEGTGFRSQRSAPMASLKPKPKTNLSFGNGFPESLLNESSVDGLDGIFHPKRNNSDNIVNNGIDIFGGSGDVDLESVLNFNNKYDQKLPTPSVSDDLIPGFGNTNVSGSNGFQPEAYPSHTSSSVASTSIFSGERDPFSMFEPQKIWENSNGTSLESSLAELENFARVKVPGTSTDKPNVATLTGIRISLNKKDGKATSNSFVSKVHRPEENQREKDRSKIENKKNEVFVHGSIPDNFFGMYNDSNHVDIHKTQTKDPIIEALFSQKSEPKLQKATSQPSYNIKKSSSVNIMNDGFNSLFSDAPSSTFQKIEGESEERRRARLNQHIRTQERMAKALAEKNERDNHTQYEQQEKRRIAEGLDYDIKRWSAGKEGNLLALLSSLQDVLWDGSGWQPVSLTDLIAPASVKKVYHKANLCLHPDKVQQKRSTLQQKYIAEKVFDLLKEAWEKHNSQGPQSSFNVHF